MYALYGEQTYLVYNSAPHYNYSTEYCTYIMNGVPAQLVLDTSSVILTSVANLQLGFFSLSKYVTRRVANPIADFPKSDTYVQQCEKPIFSIL